MKSPFHRLYMRIWLAVALPVLVLTLLFGWLWRAQAERTRLERIVQQPARDVVIRNAQGQILAQSTAQTVHAPGKGLEMHIQLPSGEQLTVELPRRARPSDPSLPPPPFVPGWNFWQRQPLGLFLLFGTLALAVALGSYPVARRITKRLENLQQGVERFGAGDLSARVHDQGHDEITFLAQHFNQAANRIQALVASHKTLLANASHELRSPLARIRMGIELLRGGGEHPMPDVAHNRLHAELERNVHELDTLIDEILLASRLDAAQGNPSVSLGDPEWVDLLALAAEESARVGAQLQLQPGTEAASLQMHGIAKLMRRLLRNLLENARRHGGEGVTVHLAHEAGHIRLEVADQGPGVAPDERERIFEPFYRASRTSESGGGVGLGLSLVQSIARQHGGHVRCLERSGGGARFVVEFPQASFSTP